MADLAFICLRSVPEKLSRLNNDTLFKADLIYYIRVINTASLWVY